MFCRKRKSVSMLTGLKVSTLACKCGFYKPEHNGKFNFQGLEMREGYIPTNRAQTVDKKNGVICLFMFCFLIYPFVYFSCLLTIMFTDN